MVAHWDMFADWGWEFVEESHDFAFSSKMNVSMRTRVVPGGGDDWIDAGPGDDYVEGGAGRNTLIGGTGKDALVSSGDGDELYGGGFDGRGDGEKDTFVVRDAAWTNAAAVTTIHDAEADDVLVLGDKAISSFSFVADGATPNVWTSSDETLVLTMTDGDLHIRNVGGGEVVVRNYSAGFLGLTEVKPEADGDDSGSGGGSGSGAGGGAGDVNHAPRLLEALADAEGWAGEGFSYMFAADAFIDPDNDPLTYSATLEDGSDLPSWLVFDPETRAFSGTPEAIGTFSVVVTASDPAGLSDSGVFALTVLPAPVNTPPQVSVPLPDAETQAGDAFRYVLADDAFTDPDDDDLSFTASLADGSDLPSWFTAVSQNINRLRQK